MFSTIEIGPYSQPCYIIHRLKVSRGVCGLTVTPDAVDAGIAFGQSDTTVYKVLPGRVVVLTHKPSVHGCITTALECPADECPVPRGVGEGEEGGAPAGQWPPPPPPKCRFSGECPPYDIECKCTEKAVCEGGELKCAAKKGDNGGDGGGCCQE